MLLRHSRLLFLSRFVFKFIPNLKHFIRIYPPFWDISSWWISCVYLDESGGVILIKWYRLSWWNGCVYQDEFLSLSWWIKMFIKIKWYRLSWWNGCVYQDEFLSLSWWIKMFFDLMWCTRLVERNLQFFLLTPNTILLYRIFLFWCIIKKRNDSL